MGRKRRQFPKRLGEKLLEIRRKLNLTQDGIISRLGYEGNLTKADISSFEHSKQEPNLFVLLAYTEIASIFLEVLVRDDIDLPDRIPSQKKSGGLQVKK